MSRIRNVLVQNFQSGTHIQGFDGVQDGLDQVEAENAERALLGTSKPYDRAIP